MRSKLPDPQLADAARPLITTRSLVIVVIAATAVGAVLRFLNLAFPELWLDETCTWYFACKASPFDFRPTYLLYENASRLYYMLVAAWSHVFGQTPWGLRSFSAVVGTLTIPLVALWLRSIAGNAPAAVGALLVAVHPLHVYYSREARFYPLWMVELIGLLWCGWLAARTNKRRYWAGYAVLLLAALWTHYFTLFLTPIALALPLLRRPSPAWWRRWLVANAIVAAVFAPWFLAVVVPVAGRGNADWIAKPFSLYPPVAAIPRTFAALAPAGLYPVHTNFLHAAAAIAAPVSVLGLACLIAAAAAFAMPAKRRPALLDARGRAFYVLCAMIPLVLAWVYSLARSPIYLIARYDQVAWPAVMVVVSVGLVELARRIREGRAAVAVIGGGTVLVSLTMSALAITAVGGSDAHRQDLIRYVARNYRPGDQVVTFGITHWDLAYYRAMLWPDGPAFRNFPASADEQVGWVSNRRRLADRSGLQREAAARAAALRQSMPPGSTVWLLLQGYDLALGRDDPAFQVDFTLDRALKAAGAIDRPSDPNLPVYGLQWPLSAAQSRPSG